MKDEVKTRLKMIMYNAQVNAHQISRGDRTLENKILRQLKDTEMTLEIFLLLVKNIPKANLNWLIYGVGEMFITNNYEINDGPKQIVSEEGAVDILREQLKTKDEQIRHLLQVLTSFTK